MLSIAKRTVPMAFILLVMPVAVWMMGWQWQPSNDSRWLRLLYWVTETVTQPWGIITHLMLCGWFLWCLRYRLRSAVMLFILSGLVILAGQSIKSWIKPLVQEPRPYVLWLEQAHHVPVNKFYALKRHARAELVKSQLQDEHPIPHWLRRHWQHETGFAFPSGHTLFAASWALLAAGLLGPRKRTLTMAVISIWAIAVMGSRLALGMHWPRDLIAAIFISWLLVTITCYLIQRWCGPLTPARQEIAKRTEGGE